MSKGLKEFAFMKGGQESKSQESKSFLSSLKGVFGNNASQVDEEDGKSDIKIKNNKEQDSAEDTG